VIKGEMSAKTTYQKNAKGPVSISECGSDGKYVLIENGGRKAESLDGWRLQRSIDGEDRVDYAFEPGYTLAAGAKVKLWAKGTLPNDAGPKDFEVEDDTWGVGANITTKLVNPTGESRATHIQKTLYS
jgi:intermediate filament protein if